MTSVKPNLLILDPGDRLSGRWNELLRRDYEVEHKGSTGILLQSLAESIPAAVLITVGPESFEAQVESVRRIFDIDGELSVLLVLGEGLTVAQRCELLAEPVMGQVEDSASAEELLTHLERAAKQSRKLLECHYLRQQFLKDVALELEALFPVMEEEVKRAAGSDQGVLIYGEPGSGRGSIARMIHQLSDRARSPFVSFNPTELSADECRRRLFGHDGARGSHRRGLLELASSGTLLVEEFDRMPHEIQGELGRALGESRVRRVGGIRSQPVEVRFVGTRRSGASKVQEAGDGHERIVRLGVHHIEVPPITKRSVDLGRLMTFYVDHYSRAHGKGKLRLSGEAEALLCRLPCTGGCVEIQRLAELAVLRAESNLLTPKEFWMFGLDVEALPLHYKHAKKHSETQFKRAFFDRVLKLSEGKVTRAATLCGLPRPSLSTMLKEVGVNAAEYKLKNKARSASA